MNLVDRLLGGRPEAVAVTDDTGTSLTYEQLGRRSAEVRGGLVAMGVGPGDRIGLALGNRAEFVIAYLAVIGMGGAAVPLNPASPAPEMAEHVTRSRVGHVLRVPGDLPEGPATASTSVDPSSPAVLCDTAGTSGRSQAAVLTHSNLLASLEQMEASPATQMRPDDVSLGVLPLFHIFGLQVVLGASLAVGAQVALREEFHAHAPLAGITSISGVPPMFDAWARLGVAIPEARLIVSGAAPLRAATAAAFEAATGRPISQGYGLTEASPVVTSGLLLDRPDPMSVGLPLPGVEVRLVGPDGEDVPEGDPGEIWVRGPNVCAGYDGEPELSAAVLAGGWLHTGDVGVADEYGRLYIVDRAKDLVIVSGFNVFPLEVEETLCAHPGIAQAAVVGVPDAHTGEAVRAVVVAAPGANVTETELIAWCRARLAKYKCPTVIEFADRLPVLPTGKVLRRGV